MNAMWIQKATAPTAVLAAWLPLAAFALALVFLRNRPKAAAGTSLISIACSLAGAVFLFAAHSSVPGPVVITARWMNTGAMTLPIGFQLDTVSLLMLLVVTSICFLVQVYSLGYMAGDPGFGRYYAFMSLFAWAMINLTLAPTLIQLYVFWELVGVSSYLLIGFWYEKFSASEAGKKAFVMTRLGDVAFLLGLLLLLAHTGNLDIVHITGGGPASTMPPETITLSALLIFGGIVGKSAQFPLLTWLPDAMEGPTPVSALLHSATMVAAGVYLFARIFPFFSLSPTAMAVFMAIGTISMLISSTMAMVARDIKQVWAYSTISQLGFMIMGLAAGGFFAGVFHLTTHAGFKALLFLCAGVFIHEFGSNDMFLIGKKGGRGLKVPMVCLIIAAASLSGLPPFSGFFSKELILAALAGLENPFWLWMGLAGAFLTAYYTFRLIFIILFPVREKVGETNGAPDVSESTETDDDHHHHGTAYRFMAVPLTVLAVISVVLGFAEHGLHQIFSEAGALPASLESHPPEWLFFTAIGLVGLGVVIAFLEFGPPGRSKIGFVERFPAVARFFAERWYLDRLYRILLNRIVYGLFSAFCSAGDRRVIDGGIDRIGRGAVSISHRLSSMHAGMIQYRLIVVFAVGALVGLYFFLS